MKIDEKQIEVAISRSAEWGGLIQKLDAALYEAETKANEYKHRAEITERALKDAVLRIGFPQRCSADLLGKELTLDDIYNNFIERARRELEE